MIVSINVQADTAGDLTTALYQCIRAIKKASKKDHAHVFPAGHKMDDSNCYGSYELEVIDDEDTAIF